MMKLVARIRDFLTEFLSKYLSVRRLFPRPPKKYGGYVLDKNPGGLVQIDCSLAVSGSESSFPFFGG